MGTIFHGLLVSSKTPKHGIKYINILVLTEAVLHIEPKKIQELLRTTKKLKIQKKDIEEFVGRATAFFSSYTNKGLFGDPYVNGTIEKQLMNSRFKDKYTDVFSNLCTILSVIDCTAEAFSSTAQAIINFIKVDGTLAWWDVEQMGILIERKGSLFAAAQLLDLLTFALDNHRLYKTNKYQNLIRHICYGVRKFYPEQRFDNILIAKRAILNCESDNGHHDLKPLSALWHISSEQVKILLTNAFENLLDTNFNYNLYEHLLKSCVINYDRKNYLMQLAKVVNHKKGSGFNGFENGNPKFSDIYCYNFLLIPYVLNIDFDLPDFKLLSGLSDFETWLANPFQFDYAKFDTKWLIAANSPYILKRLTGFQPVKEKVAEFLKTAYDKQLSKIYFKYLD